MYLDQPVAHILEIFNASGKGHLVLCSVSLDSHLATSPA